MTQSTDDTLDGSQHGIPGNPFMQNPDMRFSVFQYGSVLLFVKGLGTVTGRSEHEAWQKIERRKKRAMRDTGRRL